jgi:uncharacterized protein (DUF305 family)
MRLLKTLILMPIALVLSACSLLNPNPTISQSTSLSANEVMFAQMMIPHHEQALEMAAMVAERTDNQEINSLATEIFNAQQPEIDLMQSWIDEFGDVGMDHSGHSMGGMLSEDELLTLKQSTGTEFEKLFLTGMIAHHEGALDMADMLSNSNYPPAQKLRAEIIEVQQAEIDLMKQLLENY